MSNFLISSKVNWHLFYILLMMIMSEEKDGKGRQNRKRNGGERRRVGGGKEMSAFYRDKLTDTRLVHPFMNWIDSTIPPSLVSNLFPETSRWRREEDVARRAPHIGDVLLISRFVSEVALI